MDFNQYIKEEGLLVFYGVCGNQFKLNDKVFEAFEDGDDGYRSYLGSIEQRESDGIFFDIPLGVVKVVADESEVDSDFAGWELVDVFTGHIWLTVGTANNSDYYPWFVFNYTPDKNQRV